MLVPLSTHASLAAPPSPNLSGGYVQPAPISPFGATVALILTALICHRLGIAARRHYQTHQMAVLLQRTATLERLFHYRPSQQNCTTDSARSAIASHPSSQPSGDQ
ncbi:MAG: hypothetical protein F6K28_27120 [Microcoleus sp. SIO2G3]|nr:hypothetical protein [Microcoleus sp. SIO2G3]